MLLAAGLGTRLRPLTDTVPKPMLPVRGRPLIAYALDALARGGIREVMINLHHLPEQIRAHVGDGSPYGLHAQYSVEPTILGTGGGLKQCADFFGRAPFVVINADTLIDIDIAAVAAYHVTRGGPATLVVRKLSKGESYTPVALAPDGWVTGFGKGEHYYTGITIGTAPLLDILPANHPACLIQEGIKPLLARGERIAAFLHEGTWNDVGTPERYASAQWQPKTSEATSEHDDFDVGLPKIRVES